MKKLMVIIHSLRGGGSERVLINLLKGLERDKFSILLILYERVFDFSLPEDIETKILDIYTSRNPFKLTKGFLQKIVKLAGLIRDYKPDVIFSLLSSTNVTTIFAKLFSRRKCKLIVSEHTHPSVNLDNEVYGGITKVFVKSLYRHADTVIAVSDGIKGDLIKNFNISEGKIVVIYNPVDIEEIRRLSQENVDHRWFKDKLPVVVSVGRLTKQKGYPYLIRAFSIVREKVSCKLLIIGEGEEKKRLINMAKEYNLERDIEFLGFQKNPFKYMRNATVFVLSSLYEGFGNVIVEAMALGLPVISTDCPSGPSEIIENGKNGLLVKVGDENDLAHAILNVLTNNNLRENLGREAKIRADFFSIERIVKNYLEVFDEDPSPSL